jgi:hypothetical protein
MLQAVRRENGEEEEEVIWARDKDVSTSLNSQETG